MNQKDERKKNSDFISGSVLAVFSILYLYFSREIRIFKGIGAAPLDARFFPRFLGGTLLLLSAALMIRGLLAIKRKPSDQKSIENNPNENMHKINKIGTARVWLTGVLLFGYIAGMKYVGFLISTFLFLVFETHLLSGKKRFRIWFLVIYVAVSVALDLIFVKILNVMLPKGIVGF